MKRVSLSVAFALLALTILVVWRQHSSAELFVGAVYPANPSGHSATVDAMQPGMYTQEAGGTDEYDGVRLAAELVNDHGGVHGRRIVLKLERAESADQAPAAVKRLLADRVPIILGSHGSTISQPVADLVNGAGRIFWETGAVGELDATSERGDRVFRFAPAGATLGREAIDFVRGVLLPRKHVDPRTLRYAVAYVNDQYGRAVGGGAIARIKAAHLTLAAAIPYKPVGVDAAAIAKRIAAAKPDVLFVSAYLQDGVALRKALLKQKVKLVANIGTSSSYCMPEFGEQLGRDAVGLFASDKPDGMVLNPQRLQPGAAAALNWAREHFRAIYHKDMTAPALTGFAGANALFRQVLPKATALTPAAIAKAARSIDLPQGSLPNGSGLQFGAAGTPTSSENIRATSVIWQWIRPGLRAVVWPPSFANATLRLITPA